MSNLAILPIIIPLIAAIVLIFFNKSVHISRALAKLFSIISLGTAGYITWYVLEHGSVILETGDWIAPYGIVLVMDGLAAILVLTTNVITTACAFYAPHAGLEKRERFYFYPFFFFLITGVSGAFITGDLFNLFVFFEVLLMASYGLIVLGGGKVQLRESLKYLLINLFSSMLFVTTVAFLYAVVGTVNMAQIAERVQEVEQQGIITTIGILLFFVFATKAALFPLYYWLPKSYIVPNPVISALFGALLTKVGIYSILRVFSLIFVHRTDLTHEMFIWIAGLSMIFGVIGALSTSNIKLIIAYNIIPAIGFILLGIGVLNESGISGSIYYLVNDMIIKTALFLLVGIISYVAGTSDLRKMGGLIHYYPSLGWLLFLSAAVLAGLPPFSGFIGKLLLLKGAFEQGEIAIVIIGLLTSLLILYSIVKIFINGFWGDKETMGNIEKKPIKGLLTPVAALLALAVLLGVGAELFYPSIESIAAYLLDPEIYIDSVLKE
ncbi:MULTISPECIES: Na+/H+ antiporter subunit D [Virgibacillus]|uniref:Monovalent cation/H+ antiporter subunit D n=1 Tax=Virgibacillus pantothenticus TaxID=1473 RepID=A0A0L0QQU3_VIRPA|nr:MULTISPECIES: Na+/H+ antiporter subunit D [Virgibacillus]API90607.1 Na+/H+ antiporter subunit D [Virgibacillus sp. 6R]KNE20563.1 monovalent cation/H+ antiporter subunit D [Virgibacillus pantothenticus]MBS7429723.1 Na+/H+ antiporter subunit D [Virgibacillus sp. 19R1-5]MBU8565598.1 Na+/H+ antiporter subunit D [Virgibacillus pantothenticus]MBU8599896.1 Na+/H+ antiporter subunit D [Virgibacillus pantothenticus]